MQKLLDRDVRYTDEPLVRDIRAATSNMEFALMPERGNLDWEPDAIEVARQCHSIIHRCETILKRIEGC